ncbi:MerR family transcriptional regulator [Aeromicrobium sp. A1-2]|uniref:MerR family transcriptional regulator n=1 Tax=Aeromicrobium sp. A1-2 TaxID=2107713 RepID=UPI001C1F3AB4|nr:MerR family transcriptional regulator [Aeromicrobium sp. A1-2]
MDAVRMQIGEVADQVGLSLRTIRFYEETGLVIPSGRSVGGFRLYSESDVSRLQLIKRMKPLGFSVEEIGDFLGVLDNLASSDLDSVERTALLARLDDVRTSVDERIASLVAKVEQAGEFAVQLTEVSETSRSRLGRG